MDIIMPNKFLNRKGITIKKQKYRVGNWSEYNEALKRRGDIEIWLSLAVIDNWYNEDRKYDGTGAPELYTKLAITTCHEIRKVFRLPLRQTEGFINSLFRMKGLNIRCPSYSELSKRLKMLHIKCPKYCRKDVPEKDIVSIAIDSTGLKRFGRDEWHQEKYNISGKRSWRKLHVAVDDKHYIQGCELTSRFTHDEKVVADIVAQIKISVDHYSADGAYDNNDVYQILANNFPHAAIVIPPRKGAVYHENNHAERNRNIAEIKLGYGGHMGWQKRRNYGRRNYSELSIQRYKRILGNALQSREFSNQKQEAMISCGVLNKMTSLGMPKSYRI